MRRLATTLLLALVVAACGTSSGPVEIAAPVASATAWDKVLDEHTRRNQSYALPTLEVDLRATLVTPRLRSAYIAARERFHGRIAEDLEDELIALGKKPDEGIDAPMMKGPDGEERVVVFAAIFVRDQRFRDFSSSSSIWDVTLARGDVQVAPSEVVRLKNTPGLAGVFPYLDRFDEAYLFRFPLVDAKSGTAMMSPGGAPVAFEIASSLGTARAEWTLKGDGVVATAADQAPSEPLPEKAPGPTETPPVDASDATAPVEAPASTTTDEPEPATP